MNYHVKKIIPFLEQAVTCELITQRQFELLKKTLESVTIEEYLICDMIETYTIKQMTENKDFCISDVKFEERLNFVKKRKKISEGKILTLLGAQAQHVNNGLPIAS